MQLPINMILRGRYDSLNHWLLPMLKVARFISPLYPFSICDSKEMYVLFQQTGNCNVTIVVLRISLFGAAIYSNLLKDQPATSGDPLMREKKNTKPINQQGKRAEERNTPELEPRKTQKHKLIFEAMSSPTANRTFYIEGRLPNKEHNP